MKMKLLTGRRSLRHLNLWLGLLLMLGGQIPAAPAQAQASAISIVPEQMVLSGDVATRANTLGHCTESWLSTMPAGSIILGTDPTSCDPKDWNGGSASVNVFLPNVYPSTIYVLELSWPDQDGKGLHSPLKNQIASLLFDGHLVWSKRTTELSNFGDYYGAQHEAIKTTLVVTQASTHTLTFILPEKTAWDLSHISLTPYAMSSKIQGVGYSPYRDCQYPGGTALPGIPDMQEDLTRLFHTANAIRTYSSTGVNSQVPALAASLGLPIFAGAWLDNNANDASEIQGLIDLANSYALKGVIVGNEYYLRHRTTGDIEYLRQRILQVKSRIPAGIPVTTAEIDDLMFIWTNGNPVISPVYRPILDQLDVVMVHIYPFWAGLPIDGAAAYTVAHYKAIQNLIEKEYPGQNKRVIIGEAGWPSAGEPQLQAAPTPQNQRRYLLEFFTLAEQQGVEYFYFDGFDELWKIEEPGHVGQNWGYSYADRAAKHSFYGTLLSSDQLAPYQALSYPMGQDRAPTKNIAPPSDNRFGVYAEWPEGPGHYVPSGWMGDITSIGMYGCDRSSPHSGEMSMRISYSPAGTLGWAGAYWQYPENNWGKIDGGLDLSWANKLTFWAKGAQGGEKVNFIVGGIGASTDPYPDSLRPTLSTGFIPLTGDWQQYTIDLRGKNLKHLVGGFGWVTNKCANPSGATFFIDDVFFEYDAHFPKTVSPASSLPVYTDAAARDNHFYPSGWMGDGEVPGRVSLNECWTANPHSGETSLKISYTQQVKGWAGFYWVDPAENHGDLPGGIDLRAARRVTFWARTDSTSADVKFLVGGVGYPADCAHPVGPYPDSVCPTIAEWKTLTPTWTKYSIELSAVQRDFSRVVGGFGWVSEHPITFYLDDIVYELDRAAIDKDTTGVFRPTDGLLYLKDSNSTGIADMALNYGLGGDYPVVGDWDGDGDVTIGVYRNGSFYLRNQNTIGFADLVFPFGSPGDQPIAGDWNNDGFDTIGVYRQFTGQFLLRNDNSSGSVDKSFYLGNVGDVGIAGDWDGDGSDTTGVFRPSNGMIFLKNSNETGFADVALNYGLPGDRPVTGDWDKDGIDTIGVYRNGQFMLRNSNTIGFAELIFGLGNPGDMPIAGNWDGLP